MEGLFQEFIAAGRLSPSKPLVLRHTPESPALPKRATMPYQEYLLLILGFSCSQVTRCTPHLSHPPPRLDFFLLLPSQMQVLQLSLRCIRLCILSVMEIACHPMCCDLCLWFWATARVTRSTGGWASLEGPEDPPWHFSHVAAHIQSFKLLYSFLVASQRAQKQKLAGSPTQGHTHPKSWIKASHKTRPDFMGGRQAHP